MTELARKALSELPWGPVFATPARRGETCQITLRTPDGKQHVVAYERGAIVGATSPLVADAVARIAVLHGFATSHQLPEMTRRIQAGPDRDEIEVVAEITGLSPDNATRLRRRVVAQRAARTFAVDAGELVVDDTITIVTRRECALDVRAVMYIGARMYLSEQRLNDDLRPLGHRFVMKPEAIADLPQFGFSEAERPIIDALVAGTTVPELEARYRDIEPRALRAVVYSLWSCACLDTTAPIAAAAATAPPTPEPALSRTDTEPAFSLESDPGFSFDDTAQTPGFSLEPEPEPVPVTQENDVELELAPPSRPTLTGPQPIVGRPTRPIGEEGFAISIRPTRTLTPPPTAPGEEIVRRTTTPKDLYAQGHAATTPGAPAPPRTATTTGQLPGRPPQTTPPTASCTSTTGQPYGRTVTAPVQPRAITPQTAKGSDPAVGPYDQTEPLINPRAPTTPFVAGPRTMTTGAPPTGPRTMTTGAPPTAGPRTTTGAPPPGPRTMTTGAPPPGPRTMTTGAPPATSTPPSGVRAQSPSGRPVSREAGGSQPIPVVRSQTPSGNRTPPAGVPVTTPGQTPSSGVRVTTPPSGVRSPTTATPPVGVSTTPSGGLPRTLTPGPATPGDPAAPRPGGSQPLPVFSDNSNEFEARATSDEQSLAEEAFTRGSSALRREDLSEALDQLSRATSLNPQSIDYLAVYAWARFIAATDKVSIADDTRKILQRAIAKSKTPDVPHFYLGRVERMLGEDRRALYHFREVVELKPRHADAKAEIRMLEAKLQQAAQSTKGGGLFGLKKR